MLLSTAITGSHLHNADDHHRVATYADIEHNSHEYQFHHGEKGPSSEYLCFVCLIIDSNKFIINLNWTLNDTTVTAFYLSALPKHPHYSTTGSVFARAPPHFFG